MIVVDTNVLSEFMRPQPAPQVVRWLETAESRTLALTAVSVMEITYGVTRLPAGRRKNATRDLWQGIQAAWTGTFLTIGMAEAVAAGEVLGARAAMGRPMATRNTRDFEGLGIELINPWDERPPPRLVPPVTP